MKVLKMSCYNMPLKGKFFWKINLFIFYTVYIRKANGILEAASVKM